jgi:hypothetical protein
VVEYFEKFESSAFETDCALVLQLRLNKEFVETSNFDATHVEFGAPAPNDVVCLHPSLEDVQAQACLFVDHMVGMGQRFPRVDARVAQHFPLRQRPAEHLGPATVNLDDEIVQQVGAYACLGVILQIMLALHPAKSGVVYPAFACDATGSR